MKCELTAFETATRLPETDRIPRLPYIHRSALRFLTPRYEQMSNIEHSDEIPAIQRLSEEIAELRGQQVVAQNTATINGMTADESTQYKQRHRRLKELLRELATLDRRHEACTRLE